jgi:hypothetical protein
LEKESILLTINVELNEESRGILEMSSGCKVARMEDVSCIIEGSVNDAEDDVISEFALPSESFFNELSRFITIGDLSGESTTDVICDITAERAPIVLNEEFRARP